MIMANEENKHKGLKLVSVINPFTKIASIFFGIITLIHLLRLTFHHPDIVVGGYQVPIWISVIGFVITGIMCIGLWKEANRRL